MAIRRQALRPDQETGIVPREAIIQALMDAEAVMNLSGGVLTVVVDRAKTDVPGEMVTTYALLEWKDRTDAKQAPEAETVTAPAAEPVPLSPVEALAQQLGVTPEQLLERVAGPASEPPVPVAVGANGISPVDEPEEDVSSIPESRR